MPPRSRGNLIAGAVAAERVGVRWSSHVGAPFWGRCRGPREFSITAPSRATSPSVTERRQGRAHAPGGGRGVAKVLGDPVNRLGQEAGLPHSSRQVAGL